MNHHWHTPSSNININVHQSSWDFMSTFNSFQFHFSHHSPHVSPQDAMQRVGSQTAATNGLGPQIARVTLRDCHGNKKRRRIRTRSTHVCWGGWASGQPIFFDLNSTKLDHAASGANEESLTRLVRFHAFPVVSSVASHHTKFGGRHQQSRSWE